MRTPIVVAGAGLAGALFATYLGRRGHEVTVYESRPDLRTTDIDAGRSINLALATRGIVPLIDIGVIDRVDAITIPMRGRMIHVDGDPPPTFSPMAPSPTRSSTRCLAATSTRSCSTQQKRRAM